MKKPQPDKRAKGGATDRSLRLYYSDTGELRCEVLVRNDDGSAELSDLDAAAVFSGGELNKLDGYMDKAMGAALAALGYVEGT